MRKNINVDEENGGLHGNYTVEDVIGDLTYEYDLVTPDLLEDDKFLERFINEIKGVVRKSFEYKEYVDFLKNFKDMRYCSFFNRISNYDYIKNKPKNNIKIEIHHEPFRLHDIVDTIVRKFVFNEEPLDVLMISEEVMKVHYMDMIGLIPLSLTVHELVHSDNIIVPLTSVYGNYEKFYENYKIYMSNDVIDRYIYRKRKTETYNHMDNTKILRTKLTYYNNGVNDIPEIEETEEDILNVVKRANGKDRVLKVSI